MALTFPVLPVSEIILSLEELCGFQLTSQHFSKPDSLVWQDLYKKMMSEIVGRSLDECMMEPLHLTPVELEFPELYTDTLNVLTLINAMSKLMPPLFVDDFSSRDVLMPTSSRLEKLCSAIINFLRYKSSRICMYEDMKAEVEAEREHHESLLKRNEELKQKINSIRSERAKREPEIEKVQDEISQVSNQMMENHRSRHAIEKNISDVKAKILEKKAKADQLKCKILKQKEVEGILSQKIVTSPEKVMAEQGELRQQLESLRETEDRKKNRFVEVDSQRKDLKQVVQNCEKGIQLLEMIHASVDRETVMVNQIQVILDQVQEGRDRLQEMERRKETVFEMLRKRQEKLAKMSLMHQNKVKILQEQMESYKQDKDKLEAQKSVDSERKTKMLQVKSQVTENVRRLQRDMEQKVESLKNAYGRLLEQTDSLNVLYAKEWDDIRKLLKN
ncbi:kinetochore protein Nuf2-B-like [Dreissena polymorpha]|uniref:Kinetochore protein Nuf2 N-terminal domain-containing protein n=1 Tax=Dreissena polymorpha TaxID=45954 RepID=A0A9D4LRJ3_DREPO|nr:kinetochore protein Nuf2-B-like [Dreissena polymorpha]KAH3862579.1 hypothetical protein DPMN_025548 [Dreissena polymorpha]